MSNPIVKAVVDETLKTSHFYRQNACVRHGVPECLPATRLEGDELPAESPAPASSDGVAHAAAELAAKTVAAPAASAAKSAIPAALKTALLGAALGSGGLGGGLALYNWLTAEAPQPPASVQPVSGFESSVLPFLEDQGLHLPPAKGTP